jgi:hypothetical protein
MKFFLFLEIFHDLFQETKKDQTTKTYFIVFDTKHYLLRFSDSEMIEKQNEAS